MRFCVLRENGNNQEVYINAEAVRYITSGYPVQTNWVLHFEGDHRLGVLGSAQQVSQELEAARAYNRE
jgi:hypothetical protein